ncbi:hypothetical protein OFN63_38560, partial [Escherichia coli]|nr:hypothetical protein [Escherichia coli]
MLVVDAGNNVVRMLAPQGVGAPQFQVEARSKLTFKQYLTLSTDDEAKGICFNDLFNSGRLAPFLAEPRQNF